MRAGQFVRVQNNGWGVGKLVGCTRSMATIEYFESTASRHVSEVPIEHVRKVRIYPQTRCYIQQDGAGWLIGRVGQSVDDAYEVHFPDHKSRYVPQAELYVRCALPVRDPAEVLAVRAHETAYFHEKRQAFVRSIVSQRAAARGLAGLLSSRVRLYPHQIEVVRRVLDDPVQRYLLSDEVGLGKTIEAGIILRQLLLDNRRATALVLSPPHLREQWRSELVNKLALTDFGRRVVVVGTDDWENTPAYGFGIVVIDEAHHVADLAVSSAPDARHRFNLYRELARAVPRLLLLSATPALNREGAFLALLHLLEPDVYDPEDVAMLRSRLAARQEVGHFMLAFTESSPPFSLRRGLTRIQELAGDDPRLAELASALRANLDEDPSDGDARVRLVREVRNHVGDRYRIHRRLLRTRRQTVGDEVAAARIDPSGPPGQLVLEHDLDSAGVHALDRIEDWRYAAQIAASRDSWGEADCETDSHPLVATYLALLEAAAAGGTSLANAAAYRMDAEDDGLLSVAVGASAAALRRPPLFEGEGPLLRAIMEAEPADRAQLLVETLRLPTPRKGHALQRAAAKTLVFCSFPGTRLELVARLRGTFGDVAVATYGGDDDAVAVDREVTRFRDAPECRILVCDRSGEEGRNLQWADWLVHFDLPFSPNRIEQRIGRVDRIGRAGSVRSRVFLGPETADSPLEAWFRILDEGFGVFRSSIASLQFFVDAHLPRLAAALFRDGAESLLAEIPGIRDGIAEEQRRLREQQALDEVDALGRGAQAYLRELKECDSRSAELMRAADGWLCGGLGLERRMRAGAPGIVRYQPSAGSLIPHDFLLERLGALIGRTGTFDRETAVACPGTALFRIGEPLMDAFGEFVDWDDRGRAFAFWRVEPSLDPAPGAEWTGFRLDFLVEADTDAAGDVLAAQDMNPGTALLARRGDTWLAPSVETIFVGIDGREVNDPSFREMLERPFRKAGQGGSDYNLSKNRLSLLDLVIDPASWAGVCRTARVAGEQALRARADVRSAWHEAAEAADCELAARRAGFDARMRTCVDPREREVLEREVTLQEAVDCALVAGIRTPRLRLDSIGFIVVSGRGPGEAVREGA